MTISELHTIRLVLRGVTMADAPAMQAQFADYEIIRELAAGVPWPYPEDGARAFIRDKILPQQGKDKWVWGIFRKDEPEEFIGVVDLWRRGIPEHRGFWLARKRWGQGYITEAATAVTDHAFTHLGFETLMLSNALGNIRSRRIKETSGAVLLRTEPAKFVNPAYTEREVWELTKSAWQSRRP